MTKANSSQTLLKALLIVQTLALLVYTIFTVKNEGWTLFSVLINNITSLNWNGQFNLDFSCYLVLSGIWIMWRNRFSISSILFALIATIIGVMAFALELIPLTGHRVKL